jgi:2,4-dienoyl-CoA reductase-like NADH-dependent reductase (Old Yellow Enzyme family)
VTDALFTPFRLKRLELANRIVMAPMTRCFSPGGVPGSDVAAYYRRHAASGVGLILTEATHVPHPGAANDPNCPDFHGAAALAGWRRVCDEVHAVGGKIVPQLWHVGLLVKAEIENLFDASGQVSPHHVGPSGIAGGIGQRNRAVKGPMTDAEIADVIAAYARAAADAERLGFDGVEVHGAHGYLIDQFLWSVTNERTDRYGGDLVARTRFAAEVIAACRRAVSADFPLLLRLSQWKGHDYEARLARTPRELEQLLAPLIDAGVDAFDLSQRRFWEPEFPGSDLNLAGWTKRLSGRPTMTVGSVGLERELMETLMGADSRPARLDELLRRLERGDFDLVGVGRALLADPDWVAKVRRDAFDALRPYSPAVLATL